ncbi:hypothetical protein E2C01_095585 [Portunus trituberculatus]|uniref:Uncharacterized protein n=1 Tax=Portunus trituberculatus TaxID=210409 RepID=A0A5B7JQ74_PORTR|nr:hypothetical protein [Portunus trituberculatus]
MNEVPHNMTQYSLSLENPPMPYRFEGEDLGRGERVKAQRKEAKEWLEQQRREQQYIDQQEKEQESSIKKKVLFMWNQEKKKKRLERQKRKSL